jgi:dTDP-4-dehydrorhamnose 3,5-epimerase
VQRCAECIFQLAPYREAKLVCCMTRSILDVVVDLRREATTYCKWVGVELTARNRQMVYVAEGLASGFETLEDDTEVFYQISEFYQSECASGVRWNDPAFGIVLPFHPSDRYVRDQNYSDFRP